MQAILVACASLTGPGSVHLQRREMLLHGARIAAAGSTAAFSASAGASMTSELREGEELLAKATTSESASEALTKLLETASEYEGLTSAQLKQEIVLTMREKRSSLQRAKKWDGISEESYNRLMRSVDPWRVTELQPVAQTSVLAFAPAYVVLLVVQQLVPKVFPVAYGAMVVLVLGPLFLQIVTG